MANCALHDLLNAKDYLDEIDRYYIYNNLVISTGLQRKYQGRKTPEIEDLSSYLEELSKLSITKDRFSKKG